MSTKKDIEKEPTAFETLKVYCEKYLDPEDYIVVPETSSYLPAIYFKTGGFITYQCFDPDGEYFSGSGSLDNDEDMNEHIEQAESEGKFARIDP